MSDVMPGFGAVKERTFKLVETGEYVLTLNNLKFEADGPYGDAMDWEWLLGLKEAPADYICKANGDEVTLRTWTGADIELGSQQHEWVQVLMGRTFNKGDEPPEMDDLLGKRMIAYLTHEAPKRGKNKGILREKIVAGSAKKFDGMPKTIARGVARPEPTAEETQRAELVGKLEKLIGKAVKLETPNHRAFVAVDLNDGDNNALEMLINSINVEIQTALDA